MGVKNTTKNVLQNNRVETFLQNNRQKPKTDRFSICFNRVFAFWAFFGEGDSKTP
jgi:hypothetical protein